ncbi:MAG: diphosphomevalonate decarboxylase [Phylliscum demangeonii]|nr:MAG: diphosphomevalonate decarboxylase [Phylliscum demangeonii]
MFCVLGYPGREYWGKRDVKLNLPTNSSLSVTLSQDDLRTHTTAYCSAKFPGPDTLSLNGAPSEEVTSSRTQACLRELRSLRAAIESAHPLLPPLSTYPLNIVSTNNFPTAAGLASSAAGFAALVRAVADLYELPASATELSRIARQGSGSACRSLFGGYVAWQMGLEADGSDSVAVQMAPATHWPEMCALILVASAEKKDVSSTAGMQATVATSALFATRAQDVVPARMEEMQRAIRDKDFESFGRITMQESNSFHATCLDTYPPICYLNDVSRAAMRFVEAINRSTGKVIAAYTFDAGPNAVIYYLKESEEKVVGVFKSYTRTALSGWRSSRARHVMPIMCDEMGHDSAARTLRDGVCDVILTVVGDGPRRTDQHLAEDRRRKDQGEA